MCPATSLPGCWPLGCHATPCAPASDLLPGPHPAPPQSSTCWSGTKRRPCRAGAAPWGVCCSRAPACWSPWFSPSWCAGGRGRGAGLAPGCSTRCVVVPRRTPGQTPAALLPARLQILYSDSLRQAVTPKSADPYFLAFAIFVMVGGGRGRAGLAFDGRPQAPHGWIPLVLLLTLHGASAAALAGVFRAGGGAGGGCRPFVRQEVRREGWWEGGRARRALGCAPLACRRTHSAGAPLPCPPLPSFYFWVDVISTLSILIDMPFIMDPIIQGVR